MPRRAGVGFRSGGNAPFLRVELPTHLVGSDDVPGDVRGGVNARIRGRARGGARFFTPPSDFTRRSRRAGGGERLGVVPAPAGVARREAHQVAHRRRAERARVRQLRGGEPETGRPRPARRPPGAGTNGARRPLCPPANRPPEDTCGPACGAGCAALLTSPSAAIVPRSPEARRASSEARWSARLGAVECGGVAPPPAPAAIGSLARLSRSAAPPGTGV